MNLSGKKVLVTGAAKRIGREIALAFAQAGAELFLHYHRSQEEAEILAREISQKGSKSPRLFSADLLVSEDRKRLASKVLEEGGVDVLINNASIFYSIPFSEISEKDWHNFMGIHVHAPFFLSQSLGPEMKKRGGGRIINISDWSGLRPYKDYIAYCTSKGALITLTQGLAKALAPEVLVNAICPGPVLPGEADSSSPKKAPHEKTLLQKWGSPQEVARLAVFLAESDFMTGHYHLVDGGAWLK